MSKRDVERYVMRKLSITLTSDSSSLILTTTHDSHCVSNLRTDLIKQDSSTRFRVRGVPSFSECATNYFSLLDKSRFSKVNLRRIVQQGRDGGGGTHGMYKFGMNRS